MTLCGKAVNQLVLKNESRGTSLVAQWLRILLLVQGTRLQALVREDPTRHGPAKAVCRNY